ncbi:MAG TPA: hypothetical protein VHP63_05500 [candidate division Zixibacteria bacterium]|nr:hypothetical protein [candidate division Zixibacteria bacterium]
MKKPRFFLWVFLCLLFGTNLVVFSDVPKMISYQGRITDTGSPVDTTVDIRFRIYTTPTGGSPLWEEIHSAVTVTDGIFAVLLGSVDMTGNPLPDSEFINTNTYLGIQIGTSTEISPRVAFVSVPYAIHSATADVATSVSSSPSDWFVGGDLNDLFNGSGQLTAYPHEQYEYGVKTVDNMIHRAVCTKWNLGLRFYNVEPYFIFSDDPSLGMRWGGTMFYIGTNSADDDAATSTNWRQKYWNIDPASAPSIVQTSSSNGLIPTSVYCRKR